MSIKLGGGGGSASLINEVVFLNDTADVITTDDGRVYLKGGVYETDLTLYPDATTELVNADSFSFAADMTYAGVDAMCSDGTHLYLLNAYDNKVYKYTKAGVYVAQYSISAGNGSLKAIEWDGTDFWISSSATYIYKFDSSFNADASNPLYNLAYALGGGNQIEGITWDGTNFYVLDYNRRVLKFGSDWANSGLLWGVGGMTNYTDGITSDGTHIYVYSGYLYNYVRKFSNTGDDLGIEFSANFGNDGVIAWDGTNFRGADPTAKVYKMADANGIVSTIASSASTAGNYIQYGDGQNYLRVK